MSKIAFSAAEIAALSAFNADTMPTAVREQLNKLETISAALVTAKNVAEDANTQRGNAWEAVKEVIFAIEDATQGAPKVREMIVNSVLADYVGKDSSKPATIKSYASTGRNMLLKLCGSKWTRDELNEASYKDIREWLAPRDNPEAFQLMQKIKAATSYVEKHGFKAGRDDVALNLETLKTAYELLETSRNAIKGAKDSETHTGQLAKAVHDLKPQAPTAPTAVEVSNAA